MTATMKAAECGLIVAAIIYTIIDKEYFYGVFIWESIPLTPKLSSHQLDITPMPKRA